MPKGPRSKSNEQKKATGQTRPSRTLENVVEFPVLDETPKPPSWVKLKAGKDLWGEIAPVLFQQRILRTADVYALGHLCNMHANVVGLVRKGLQPTASEMSQLRQYFAEFGMTPASRTRVAAGDGGQKGNKFGNNGRKPGD